MAHHAPDDWQRTEALKAFQILDSPPEPIFDRLVRFASFIFDMPIATISLIDESRQWFKSEVGLDLPQTERSISFCTHTIARLKPMVIEDTHLSTDFCRNPLVTGPPNLRFYAGVPLIAPSGFAIGTVAVMDTRPRKMTAGQIDALVMLAEQVMTHIELRRQRRELDRAIAARDSMNAELETQTDRLLQAQRVAKLGIWEMELPARMLHFSPQASRILGIGDREQRIDLQAYLRRVHADDLKEVRARFDSLLAGGSGLDIVHRISLDDRKLMHVHLIAEGAASRVPVEKVAGTIQDITHQRNAQQEIDLLYTSIARVGDIIMITEAEPFDEPGPRIVFVNQAFEERTGYKPAEVIGRSPRFLQGRETQRNELDKIRQALERNEHVSVEVINYTKDHEKFWVEIDIDPVMAFGDRVSHFVSVQRDITQRKATEEKIERLAFFDTLTHLPNRRLFIDRLNHAIDMTGRTMNNGALLFIDLDNFKSLNDSLGHDKGDLLLVQVARRMERVSRKSNTVARLGGDEFVILLEDLNRGIAEAANQAELVGRKVLAEFQAPFNIQGYVHHCTASIGVTLFGAKSGTAEDTLKRADLAMYQAKAAGRNSVCFFDQGMQSIVNKRAMLDRDFRASLLTAAFVLHYQPQFDHNGSVVGVEALIRWKHPHRGLLYPLEFIPLAEETGLIVHLGHWVMEAACKQLAEWENTPDPPALRISVNVSARQFHHPDFCSRTLGIIEAAGINAEGLMIELTESALVEDIDDTVEKMALLRSRGIRFSLDDFGTGYSSLTYLKRLPLDEIKIDRAFVHNIVSDPGDAAISQTIVSLCRILGFDVLAEGVETELQRQTLLSQGCHLFQGNLFSAAVPPADLLH